MDNTDDTLDADKVIDLASKQDLRSPRKRNARPKGAGIDRVQKIKAMCREEIARSEAARLDEKQELFCSLLVSGCSIADAYEEAYPENCYTLTQDADGNTRKQYLASYQARFDRGNRLTRLPGVRARIIILLEQEEVEVSNTSRRLDNMILKSLEKEATDPRNPASARIQALKQLQAHRAVQVSEQQAAERAKADLAPEELLAQIKDKLTRFRE